MSQSIKKNFLYSSIMTVSNYLFPLIIFPYVSRVLGVDRIGICNFVDSIINYFVLFSMMGISTVGVREISKCRDNYEEMSRRFSGLFSLTILTTVLSILVLLISMYTMQSLFPYRKLLYIGVMKLFFNLFLIEWFFTGMENFAYITNRSIIIKIIYLILIFLLIKVPDDYVVYYFLLSATVVLNGIVNVFYCRKYVSFNFKGMTIRPFIATFLTMGLYTLVTNVYTSLNVIWLGFVSGTREVGYYTTATRLIIIILAIFTALSNVIYPRVSLLYSQRKYDEYWGKIKVSVECIFTMAFPICIVALIFGPTILHFLVGNGYEGSYTPFRIIVPLILIIGYEQVLIFQILMARSKDKIVTINSIIGALVSLLLNYIVVPIFSSNGTAVVWLLSEICIMTGALIAIYKTTSYRFQFALFFKYICGYLPLAFILCVFYQNVKWSDILVIITIGFITAVYSIIVQLLYLKNPIVCQLIDKVYKFTPNK